MRFWGLSRQTRKTNKAWSACKVGRGEGGDLLSRQGYRDLMSEPGLEDSRGRAWHFRGERHRGHGAIIERA